MVAIFKVHLTWLDGGYEAVREGFGHGQGCPTMATTTMMMGVVVIIMVIWIFGVIRVVGVDGSDFEGGEGFSAGQGHEAMAMMTTGRASTIVNGSVMTCHVIFRVTAMSATRAITALVWIFCGSFNEHGFLFRNECHFKTHFPLRTIVACILRYLII